MPRRFPEARRGHGLKPAAHYERKCSRVSYDSQVDAKIAMSEHPAPDCLIRRCPVCHGWHVIAKGEALPAAHRPRRESR